MVPNETASFGTASSRGVTTDQDRGLIRDLVKELATVADLLTQVAIGRFPIDGSIADAQLRSSVNAGLPTADSPVRAAHVSLIFANSAGTEHTRAFINTVNSKRFSFSLATLTRGALEAFAKSYFLMDTDDPGELLSRHISLAISEMAAASKHNDFTNQSGEPADVAAYLTRSKELLGALNLPLITGPDLRPTKLVTTLLDKSANTGMGRKFYSQLSGVAHGESAALGMFLVAQPGKVAFRIPREMVVEYAGMLSASCVLVVDRMVEMFGLEDAYQAQWNGAKRRADVALKEMQAKFP